MTSAFVPPREPLRPLGSPALVHTVPDALHLPPWAVHTALGLELIAALGAIVIVKRGRNAFVWIAAALWTGLVCEAGRALLAIRLDRAPVPYYGIDSGLDAIDLVLTMASLVLDCVAVILVLRDERDPSLSAWSRLSALGTAAIGGVAWLALVVAYPSPWSRGVFRAHALAIVHGTAASLVVVTALFWVFTRTRPRIEHAAALALALAHFGLLAGPYSPFAGSEAYALHRPWSVVLFGLAWAGIVAMEAAWITRRYRSRSSHPC